ncbi:GatB/YqeY domain-containing protein [Anaeropeptidivorans aminofermentans]|jgi:hypothetical protein|uniref:GatB/YqeY domain-containing protein n=1 Tax=Anaeropeptidivorans aminofermentans TaxID=2934315 RepID=UPI0020245427|nr:GatB/YqeY domain-containing protein [Anaeropeptidivorans aminofermentans]MBE6011192.1 GatB/YqeY domain-containing protein [Lachnospiraceae bacterium]
MSLKEQLFSDLKEAMREKDTLRKDTIQIVRAGILQIEKDEKIVLDDFGVIDVISRELKKRNDVLPDYEKSGREDSVKEILRQIELLKSYLPKQLSENEIETIVASAIEKLNASSMKDMGAVMAAVTPELKGKADNKTVSGIVKKLLNKQ